MIYFCVNMMDTTWLMGVFFHVHIIWFNKNSLIGVSYLLSVKFMD